MDKYVQNEEFNGEVIILNETTYEKCVFLDCILIGKRGVIRASRLIGCDINSDELEGVTIERCYLWDCRGFPLFGGTIG